MITYRAEQTINRPVDQVFPYIADPRLHPQWMEVTDVEQLTPGEVGVGTTVRIMMNMGSRRASFTWEVTEFEPDAKVSYRTVDGPMHWDGTFTVRSRGDAATHITASGRVGLRGLMRLMEPFIRGEVRRGEANELVRLKDLLEGGA